MRRLTPLSLYNRKASFSKVSARELGGSLLAFLAAGESKLLKTFLDASGCPDPWLEPKTDA